MVLGRELHLHLRGHKHLEASFRVDLVGAASSRRGAGLAVTERVRSRMAATGTAWAFGAWAAGLTLKKNFTKKGTLQ